MLTAKRVLIATIMGSLCGLLCMWMASSNPDPESGVTTGILLSIFISRAMLGFMIGISALKITWWLHGIFLGLISSIPMAIAVMDKMEIFIGTFVMGMVYGFLIELVTSKLFKAKPVAYVEN